MVAAALALFGLATGESVQAQTLPNLISYTFTLAETKTIPGTSTAPGVPCGGTIAATDQIGALALVSVFDGFGCSTDGNYNHNDYRVDRGTLSGPGGAANLPTFKIFEPRRKATQFLSSHHALYYRFPTVESYTVYTYSDGAFTRVVEVPASAIPNTTDLVPVPSAASPIRVSEVIGSITYVIAPTATRVSSFTLLAPGIEGARVASTPFGNVLKYRYAVQGTPFDTSLDFPEGPASHDNAYSVTRRFFLVRNGNNPGVVWQAQGSAVVNLTWFGADRMSPSTVALPNPLAYRLACAAGDDAGGVYYLTIQPENGAPNATRLATLTKVGPGGAIIISRPVDMSRTGLDMVSFDGNVAALKFLNGKLALMTGRLMHQTDDGINHQGGIAVVFDATTLAVERDWGQITGHSFGNVLTSNANGEFIGIDLGDGYPRGVHLHKFTGANISSRVVSTFKAEHSRTPQPQNGGPSYPVYTEISGGGTTYYKWSNDTRTYTELGGVVQTPRGYAVSFVGEPSPAGLLLDNRRVGGVLNDPRNIGWLTVREDFQNASGGGLEVSDDLVTSTGSVEAGGVFTFADWSRQRNAGLVWLTQYTRADQNATRLKMTPRADGSLLLLWELWTASSYVATKGMTVSANGAIVNGETDLTNHVRLTRSDDLMRVGDAIYLVAGNRTDRVLELIVLETQTLTVARSGTGGGTVASSPSGIDCGGTCSAGFGTGSTVLLTATSNAGSVFAGWTGAGCTGTAPCTVTLNAAATVTATFNVAPAGTFALTVSKSGSGIGTVTSAPTGINCGTNCVSSFNSGASVTLTAAPAAGSMFSGWSGGGCAGTGPCAVTLSSATAVTATFNPATNIPRLVNISTRGQVGTGDSILIGGFIVGSGTPKKVIIKGRGPSMAPLGVQGTLSDPAIRLFSGATAIDFNDDWPSASNAAEITASGQAPTNTKESAILTTVTPGVPYTVHVTGVGATTGIAIVEVFELDKPEVPLLNISTRGPVLSGDQVMIGGFIIQGDAAQQVLVIAKGPSLAAAPFSVPGSLADPILELYQAGVAAPIETNDNWVSSSNMATIQASGNAPTHSLESAIIRTLAPGAYTAIVKGVGAFQGIGLVEVYRK